MIAEKLRKAVLQAAMQGKLTEQLPEDGDARDLLAEIQQKTQRKIKAGEIKATKPLPPIDPEEVLYEIPENWVWTRLGNVISDNGQKVPDSEFTYIDIGSINNKTLQLGDLSNVLTPENAPSRARKIVKQGDGLYSTVRPYLHNACVIDKKIEPPPIASTGFLVIAPIHKTSVSYVLNWLVSPVCDKLINDVSNSRGVAYPAIPESKLKRIPIPLPPYSEQLRIIARIESFLLLLFELEKKEVELDVLEKEFPEKLKKSLLQAAMQGKLTEQLSEDGDAKYLLAEIQQEKKRKIKAGEIKAAKPLPPIDPDEIPYEIPENWVWTQLGNVITNNGQKVPDSEFTYIDIGSINNKTMQLGDLSNVLTPENAPSRARKIIKQGDGIYSTVRPYLHNACVIDKKIEPPPIASTGFFVIAPIYKTSVPYVLNWLVSPVCDNLINDVSNSRGVAYPAIPESNLKRIPIPLAPFSEQKRIVSVLDKLLPLSEGLRQS